MTEEEKGNPDTGKVFTLEEFQGSDDGFLSDIFGGDEIDEEEEFDYEEEEKKKEDILDIKKTVKTSYEPKAPTTFRPGIKRAPKKIFRPISSSSQKSFRPKPKKSVFQKSKVKIDEAKKHRERSKTDVEKIIEKAKPKTVSPRTSSTLKRKEEIVIGDAITVKEFAEKMGVSLSDLMKKLLVNKIVVSANSNIDFDTANLIGLEFDIIVNKETSTVSVDDLIAGNLESILAQDKDLEGLKERCPIVTIMGHVDHGKTKLLDYIRKTSVVEGEAGGITQSIGASKVEYNGKVITFVDTPGHELFTSMRARGSKITDIAIIVVAADEGIKPQTIEAISHAKDSGVPIIIAVTKIDKFKPNMDQIKGQISEHGLVPEDWGGDTHFVQLSSITGEGVDELLEIILLQSEILELKYNSTRGGVGVVLEANKDAKRGVTTSIILMTGTLKVGDVLIIHNTYGKVRKMVDWKGNDVVEAKGGEAVMILGIHSVPEPGRLAEVVVNEKAAHTKINLVDEKMKSLSKDAVLQSVLDKISKGENVQLKLVLKADSFGSLEALKYAIKKIEMPENIEVKIVYSDIGAVSDSDLVLAKASGSFVIGFNIPFGSAIKKKADNTKIVIKAFNIIYEVVEYVENLAKGLIKIEEQEVYIGRLEVLGVFFKKGKEMVIGGKVTDGKLQNGAMLKIKNIYDKEEVQDSEEKIEEFLGGGRITSLKKGTENVDEILSGHECGMKIKVSKKVAIGDILEFFVME